MQTGIVGPDTNHYHRGDASQVLLEAGRQGILAVNVGRPSMVKLRYYARQPGCLSSFESSHATAGREVPHLCY